MCNENIKFNAETRLKSAAAKALNLEKYLPFFLKNSRIMNVIQNKIFPLELENINFHIEDLLNQCFVDSATWSLELWEQFLDIPIEKLKPIEYRRSVIKAKLRGTGTVTKLLIKQVASAYSGGDVEVIELPQKNKFIIKFVGTLGVPLNMKDLTRNIEEIKPAHLTFEYKYTFSIWYWYRNYTWGMVKNLTWETIRTTLKPEDLSSDYKTLNWR